MQKAAPARKRSRIEDSDSEEEVTKVEERPADGSLGESAAKVAKQETSEASEVIRDTMEGDEGMGVAGMLRTPPKRLTARKHTGKVKTPSPLAPSSVSTLEHSSRTWLEIMNSMCTGMLCVYGCVHACCYTA